MQIWANPPEGGDIYALRKKNSYPFSTKAVPGNWGQVFHDQTRPTTLSTLLFMNENNSETHNIDREAVEVHRVDGLSSCNLCPRQRHKRA